MSISELIKQGKIRRFRATDKEIDRALAVADRDIAVAEEILETDTDWCFSIPYNCVLQACRAFMFSKGYRPASFEAHRAVFEFMEVVIEERFKKKIAYFDRMRKKRHRTVYDEQGLISAREARELLDRAKQFLAYVKTELRR